MRTYNENRKITPANKKINNNPKKNDMNSKYNQKIK